MRLTDFFSTHPVFTADEFADFLSGRGSANPWTRKALLAHHRSQGHILRVRRGLYAVVPPGMTPEDSPVDPFLLAAKAASDAVLAYHTALEFHGRAYSLTNRILYLTSQTVRPWAFRLYRLKGVAIPKRLLDARRQDYGIVSRERAGMPVAVTSLERTLVDVLDRPSLGGGWEEIWRSLESVEFFDLRQVVEYALMLGNATTVAKVGFYLEQHRETLMVEDAHLAPLRKLIPREPHYMAREERGSGRLLDAWNLVVPVAVIERAWATVT